MSIKLRKAKTIVYNTRKVRINPELTPGSDFDEGPLYA
jgi:hypothetical protein